MIDYQQLIDNLDDNKVIQLMIKLGSDDYIEKDESIQFKTICHNLNAAEASEKLYYYRDSHLFVCYTECGPMNIFQFLKHYYNCRGYEYDWYNDIVHIVECCGDSETNFEGFQKTEGVDLQKIIQKRSIEIEQPQYSEKVLDVFIKYYPVEWLSDGISKEAMDKFNIKYSISQNKIIIPHYDACNRLIGIRGRALNPEEVELAGKYMPVQIENNWYSHKLSLNLYGLNKTKEIISKAGYAFVCESEKAVLQMETFGVPNCAVAVCGSNFSKYQLNLLLKYCWPDEIVLCFDNEEEQYSQKYFDKLYNICKKYKNYCNFSFIYDRYGLTKKKDSPTDRGADIFFNLLDKRVKVR